MIVTVDKFVETRLEAYKQGKTAQWVMQQLGVNIRYVNAKASYLRGKGVKLPKLVHAYSPHGGHRVDYSPYQAMVEEATK